MKFFSNIQIYKKIWAGRHSTDAISVNNTGNRKWLAGLSPGSMRCALVVRTVPFDPPPSPWGDGVSLIRLCLIRQDFGPAHGNARIIYSLLQTSEEPGNVPKVPCEDEGADGGAHAEDQGNVCENEEILERGRCSFLRKFRTRLEEY